jgi:hypothetical protein
VKSSVLREGTTSQGAEKRRSLGGRSFSSDNKCLAVIGLQPLREWFCDFRQTVPSDTGIVSVVGYREVTTSQLPEKLSFCHSEQSLRSEELRGIARLLCDESLSCFFGYVL